MSRRDTRPRSELTCIDHGFDCERLARLHHSDRLIPRVVRDVGRTVEQVPYAMAAV